MEQSNTLSEVVVEEDLVPQVVAPEGVTYQWVAVNEDPEAPALKRRLANGWTCVDPKLHRHILSERGDRIYIRGLVLLQKPTIEVEKTRAAEREANKVSFADLVRKHVNLPDGAHSAQVWERKVK